MRQNSQMKVTEQLAALTLPVFAAPMFLISGVEMVLACCKAGIVGSFPASNARTDEEYADWLMQISRGAAKIAQEGRADQTPLWAANLVVHRTNARLPALLDLTCEYEAPIVITALGGPKAVVDPVHAYGGMVFADVNSVTLAKKAVDVGVDGLVLISSGAGGHTGDLCNLAFVDEVRQFWEGPIILGGAINTGSAVHAAQVMGADYAYVGTGLIATEESLATEDHKKMVTECGSSDLIVTKAFTGANASMLIPSISKQGIDPASLAGKQAKMNFTGQDGAETKPWKGIYSAGQGIASTRAVEPVADVVKRIRAQYRTSVKKWSAGQRGGQE